MIHKGWIKPQRWTLDLDGYPMDIPHWIINSLNDT